MHDQSGERRAEQRRSFYGRHFLNVLTSRPSASFSELARWSDGVDVLISEALEWIVQAERSGLVEYLPVLGDTGARRVRLSDRGRVIALHDRRAAERRAA